MLNLTNPVLPSTADFLRTPNAGNPKNCPKINLVPESASLNNVHPGNHTKLSQTPIFPTTSSHKLKRVYPYNEPLHGLRGEPEGRHGPIPRAELRQDNKDLHPPGHLQPALSAGRPAQAGVAAQPLRVHAVLPPSDNPADPPRAGEARGGRW